MADQEPVKLKARKKATGSRVKRHPQAPATIPQSQEQDYTDEQFYADLKKASKQLDAMAEQALEEHRQGKTRKFPV